MQGRKLRGTTQLEEKILQLKKFNGSIRFLLVTVVFTEKALGCNSFFYVCQLSPPLALFKQGQKNYS